MPGSGGLTFNYRVPFQKKWVFKLPEEPTILSQHIRYSKEADEMFPKATTNRFTIVRDPGTLFPSLFKYFGKLNPAFSKAGTFENFMNSPSKFA